MAVYSTFKKINSAAIINGSVRSQDIAQNAVTGTKFQDLTITNTQIADGAITTDKLASSLNISGMTVSYRALVSGDFANSSIGGGQIETDGVKNSLGYTPVNKAGDTLTGQLTVGNSDVVGRSDYANSGFRIDSQNMYLTVSGNNRHQINSSGHPIANNQPAWMASGRGGWRYGNQYDGANSWRELDNIGWNFSTQGGVTTSNNCRVTVPIAGYYHCYLQGYWYNNSNSTNGYTHWNIALNGGNGQMYGGRTPHTMFAYGLRNNHAPGVMTAFTRYMNAGQYVTPRPYFGGNQGRIHGNHACWAGYLIG